MHDANEKNRASTADPISTVLEPERTAYAAHGPFSGWFDTFAATATRWAGSPFAFSAAVACVAIWLVAGPIFHWSDAWQLVINTGTTIITFLMVFLIQQSQNKDSVALHIKLNELLASHRGADSTLIGIEDASEEDLRRVADAYLKLAERVSGKAGKRPETKAPAAAEEKRGDDEGRSSGGENEAAPEN